MPFYGERVLTNEWLRWWSRIRYDIANPTIARSSSLGQMDGTPYGTNVDRRWKYSWSDMTIPKLG